MKAVARGSATAGCSAESRAHLRHLCGAEGRDAARQHGLLRRAGVSEIECTAARHSILGSDLNLCVEPSERSRRRADGQVIDGLDRLVSAQDQDRTTLRIRRLVPPDLPVSQRYSSQEKPALASSSSRCLNTDADEARLNVVRFPHSSVSRPSIACSNSASRCLASCSESALTRFCSCSFAVTFRILPSLRHDQRLIGGFDQLDARCVMAVGAVKPGQQHARVTDQRQLLSLFRRRLAQRPGRWLVCRFRGRTPVAGAAQAQSRSSLSTDRDGLLLDRFRDNRAEAGTSPARLGLEGGKGFGIRAHGRPAIHDARCYYHCRGER